MTTVSRNQESTTIGVKKPERQRLKIQLQLARAAERRHREKREKSRDHQGHGDEPVGDVAGPRAESSIEPAESKYGESRARHLVKKLLERAPEACEPALLLRPCLCARYRRHESSLTKKKQRTLLPMVRKDWTRVLWTDWRQRCEPSLYPRKSRPKINSEVRENQPCNSTIT